MSDLRQQAQEVFRQVFDNSDLVLRDEMTPDDIAGWDSLAHINLMIALERRFHFKFGTAEILQLEEDDQNMGDFLRLIEKKLRRTDWAASDGCPPEAPTDPNVRT